MAGPLRYGWAPYWAPYLSFLILIEIGRRAPEAAALVFLALKVLVPGGLVLWYASRGLYPELRGLRPSPAILLDVGVGLLGAILWVAPFLLFDGLRPDAPGFDPRQLGESAVPVALTLRAVGYAAVTPFVEELFVRSWLIRFADVYPSRRRDFRTLPMARFSRRSFVVVVAFLVFTHQPWEWGVMLAWTLLTMAWLYHRRHLLPVVIAHAVTNGAILAFVVLCDGRFRDASGQPISLWFFV